MGAKSQNDAEEVLARFAAQHPRPLADDVRKWAKLHPELSTELLALALDLNRMAAIDTADPPRELSRDELDQAWETHLRASRSREGEIAKGPRLEDLVAAAGIDLADLADTIDIDRRVLNSLAAGRIMLPVSRRLLAAVAVALRTDAAAVATAITASYLSPTIAFAKSQGQPATSRVTYGEAIVGSEMTEARKAFWTDQD